MFWILLVIGGATALSFTFVIKLLKVLDNNLHQSLLAPVLITTTIYCFFTASYTLIYRKQLIEFFNKVAAIDLNSPISEDDQQQEEKEKTTAPAEPEKVDIPKFLVTFRKTNSIIIPPSRQNHQAHISEGQQEMKLRLQRLRENKKKKRKQQNKNQRQETALNLAKEDKTQWINLSLETCLKLAIQAHHLLIS